MDCLPLEFYFDVIHNFSASDLKEASELSANSQWKRVSRIHGERRVEACVFLTYSVGQNAFTCVFSIGEDEFTFAETCRREFLAYFRVKSVTMEKKTIRKNDRRFVIAEGALDGIFAFIASHFDRLPRTFEMLNEFPHFDRFLTALIPVDPLFFEVKLRYFKNDSSCCSDFLKSQLTKRIQRLHLYGNWPTSINEEIGGFVEKCWTDPSYRLSCLVADNTAIVLSFDRFKQLLAEPRALSPRMRRRPFAFVVKVEVSFEEAMNHVAELLGEIPPEEMSNPFHFSVEHATVSVERKSSRFVKTILSSGHSVM